MAAQIKLKFKRCSKKAISEKLARNEKFLSFYSLKSATGNTKVFMISMTKKIIFKVVLMKDLKLI